jgi:hypothetical protein
VDGCDNRHYAKGFCRIHYDRKFYRKNVFAEDSAAKRLAAQQMGGRIMAARQREAAVKDYLLDPKLCKNCCNPILPGNKSISVLRRAISFCDPCSKAFVVRVLDTPLYQISRRAICLHARRALLASAREKKCEVCGYDKHVEACHVRALALFAEDALVREVNDLSNLKWLCRNHHWEHDHALGITKLTSPEKKLQMQMISTTGEMIDERTRVPPSQGVHEDDAPVEGRS